VHITPLITSFLYLIAKITSLFVINFTRVTLDICWVWLLKKQMAHRQRQRDPARSIYCIWIWSQRSCCVARGLSFSDAKLMRQDAPRLTRRLICSQNSHFSKISLFKSSFCSFAATKAGFDLFLSCSLH